MRRLIVACIFGCVIGCAVQLLNSGLVNADADWLMNPISVVSRHDISGFYEGYPPCSGATISIDSERFGYVSQACVFGSTAQFRVARFWSEGSHHMAIAFPGHATFYEARGFCSPENCVYSPESDSLIGRHALPQWRFGAHVYKDFSKALVRKHDAALQSHYYSFEPNREPDFTLRIGEYEPSVEALSISENGRWAVFELRNTGLIRLDITTFETRRVLAPGARYGVANDPRYEIAITNDGRSIATVGWRVGISLIVVTDTCGDPLGADMQDTFAANVTSCPVGSFDESSFSQGVYYFSQPRFNRTSERLSLVVVYQGGRVERTVLAPTTSTEQEVNLAYMALGDSFTSGEGELQDEFYKPFSNQPLRRCHTSTRSYPYQLALSWQVYGENVACSGARTTDIIGKDGYLGQGGYLEFLKENKRTLASTQALHQFYGGTVAQIDFVSMYQPKVISIGIGGNDVGLVAKLTACLNPGVCEWVHDPVKRYATAQEIATVFEKVRETIRIAKIQSPASKIVMVGYPLIIEDSELAQCDVVLTALLNKDERIFINQSIHYLNRVIRAASNAERVQYIDVERVFGDSWLCGVQTPVSMNGIRFGDDIAPFDLVEDFKAFGAESFHPTPEGHIKIATKFLEVFPSVEEVEVCETCTGTEQVPVPSSYWGNEVATVQQRASPSSTDDRVVAGETIKIISEPLTFKPDTSIRVVLHSDPIELAMIQATSEGGVEVTVSVPPDTPLGYHVLHMFGTAPDDTLIDVYRTVAVTAEHDTSLSLTDNTISSDTTTSKPESDRVISHSVDPIAQGGSNTEPSTIGRLIEPFKNTGVMGAHSLINPLNNSSEILTSPRSQVMKPLSFMVLLYGLCILCTCGVLWVVFFLKRKHSSRDGRRKV